MKCCKYQFITPLFSQVIAEALDDAYDGTIELNEECTLTLFNRHSEFEAFLEQHMEDLVQHIPEQLKEQVIKAEFGHHCSRDGGLHLLTEITVKGEYRLSTEEECCLREWITGQLSDGWGESLEQQVVIEQEVNHPTISFDEDECEFVTDEGYDTARYYLMPWNSRRWSIALMDIETVEVDIEDDYMAPIKLVHSFALPQPNRGLRLINIYAGASDDMEVFLRVLNKKYGLDTRHQIEAFTNPGFCYCSRFYIAIYHDGISTGIYPTIGINDVESHYKWMFEDTGELIRNTLRDYDSTAEFDADIAPWMIQEIIINHH